MAGRGLRGAGCTVDISGRDVENEAGEAADGKSRAVVGLAEVVRRDGVEADSWEEAPSAAASIS